MEPLSGDPVPRMTDPLLPVRGMIGVLLVVTGAFVLAWVLLLAYGFLKGTWTPGIEQRLVESAGTVSSDLTAEAGAAALVAVPLVSLLGLALLASIGGRMIAGGASLLQPDWLQALRRIEAALGARRPGA